MSDLMDIHMPITELVMWPASGDTTAVVLPAYQSATSDPTHRFKVPAGNVMVMVSNETRFLLTPMLLRGGETVTLPTNVPIYGSRMIPVSSESGAEMWFTLSLTPTVFDRRTTRIGVTIIPLVQPI